jgi:acetyl esterase/lipase
MKRILLGLVLFAHTAFAQKEISLYSGIVPNAIKPTIAIDTSVTHNVGNNKIDILHGVVTPTLTLYLPDPAKATGTAVIICPGGGYSILATSHEGHDMAKKFNEAGITAFVLKYRLPRKELMTDKRIGSLQDAQRAIQLVRENAKQWNVNPSKIGILGSSAGGHLASTAGTHLKKRISTIPTTLACVPTL